MTRTQSSFATNPVILFIILITAINLASAIEFTFDYPNTVQKDTEFEVQINSGSQEIHDVKIYVHDDVMEFSEIYDGSRWRSPFNYIIGSFPSQIKYKLISHYIGETEICVQLRLSGNTNFDKICETISINQAENNPSEPPEENEIPPEPEPEQQDENPIEEAQTPQLKEISRRQPEKIILTSPDQEKPAVVVSKSQKSQLLALYGFTAFCVVVIIFLAFKKL